MTSSAAARASESTAEALLASDHHYVAAVTTMGDQQAVVASEDILTANGIKLVAKGTRIDSRLREKLTGHRLQPPIDCSLSTSDIVTPQLLASEADYQIGEHDFWRQLANRSGDAQAMRHGLARLKLPPPVAFKLTVARTQRPSLFRHSLRVALLAHYLALRLDYPEKSTHHLLLAALCHDLGEMHTDPAILDPGHRITEAERRFVYVHPATGYVLLRDTPGVPSEVARAVLHHHERLDGSGYPAGLQGEQIERLALPLMVADTAESVLNRFDQRRLSTLLRLSQKKYNSKMVALLHEATAVPTAIPSTSKSEPESRQHQLETVSRLLTEWSQFRRSIDEHLLDRGQPGLGFLDDRMQNLNSLLYQFGFDPAGFDALVALAQSDPEVATELSEVLDELQFQIAEMEREIQRREGEVAAALPDTIKIAFDDWHQTLRNALPT